MSFKILDDYGNIIKIGTVDFTGLEVGSIISLSRIKSFGSELIPEADKLEVLNWKFKLNIAGEQIDAYYRIKFFNDFNDFLSNEHIRMITKNFGIYMKTDRFTDRYNTVYYNTSVSAFKNTPEYGNWCSGTPNLGWTNQIESQYSNYSHVPATSTMYPTDDEKPLLFLAVPEGQTPPNVTTVGIFVYMNNSISGAAVGYSYTNSITTPGYAENIQPLIDWVNHATIIEGEPPSKPPSDVPGSFDDWSDPILPPSIEDINISTALSNRLLHAYYMDTSRLDSLSSSLWSTSFFDSILKNQNAPIENIQKIHFLPMSIEATGNEPVKIGNYNCGFNAPIITKQFQEYSLGSIAIDEYFGTSLDYDSELSIFLPFIGERKLPYAELALSIITLTYRVDVLTGNCLANISVKRTRDNTTLQAVMFSFEGNLSNEIPLSQTQNRTLTSLINNGMNVISNPGISSGLGLFKDVSAIVSGNESIAIRRTGNLNSSIGYLGVMIPFITLRRPINVKPDEYREHFGFPSYYTHVLENVSGFNKVASVISEVPENIAASDWMQILGSLQTGFYVNKYKNLFTDLSPQTYTYRGINYIFNPVDYSLKISGVLTSNNYSRIPLTSLLNAGDGNYIISIRKEDESNNDARIRYTIGEINYYTLHLTSDKKYTYINDIDVKEKNGIKDIYVFVYGETGENFEGTYYLNLERGSIDHFLSEAPATAPAPTAPAVLSISSDENIKEEG